MQSSHSFVAQQGVVVEGHHAAGFQNTKAVLEEPIDLVAVKMLENTMGENAINACVGDTWKVAAINPLDFV